MDPTAEQSDMLKIYDQIASLKQPHVPHAVHHDSTDHGLDDKPYTPKYTTPKLVIVSKNMQEFLGSDDPISRVDVLKRITSYVAENNLQHHKYKKYLTLDDKLAKLFPECCKLDCEFEKLMSEYDSIHNDNKYHKRDMKNTFLKEKVNERYLCYTGLMQHFSQHFPPRTPDEM